MNSPSFDWDKLKAEENAKNHGVSFDEAKTVFYDEQAKSIGDPDHSSDEDRFVILGISSNFRILLVCHCYRSEDDVIRIISARKADKVERNYYSKGKDNA